MTVAVNEFLTISPSGRASREAYWFSLFASLLFWGTGLLAAGFVPQEAWRGGIGFTDLTAAGAALISAAAFFIAILLLATAVIRRLHDLSCSGFAAFFLIVPGINLICLLLLGILKGTSRGRFGPAPLQIPTVNAADADAAACASARRRGEASAAETAQEAEPAQKNSERVGGVEVELAAQSATELDDGEKTAQTIFMNALAGCAGEAPSVQIQVKARAVEKLRKLLVKKRIMPASFEYWKRRILSM